MRLAKIFYLTVSKGGCEAAQTQKVEISADKALTRPVSSKNNVGWVKTANGREERHRVNATGEWINKKELNERKEKRRLAFEFSRGRRLSNYQNSNRRAMIGCLP